MSGSERGGGADAEAQALAARWPRLLIEQGTALALAERWSASRRAARADGRPPHAHHALTPELATALFQVRQARRLVRGLEASEEVLTAQALGVQRAASERAGDAPARVSRLLLVSQDGSSRFYRQVERLVRHFGPMLEVLVVTTDELALGAAAFGPGQRARALLVDHKEAVVRVLGCLDGFVEAVHAPG